MIVVCKECPKRKIGCHAYCRMYKVAKKIHDQEKENRNQEVFSRINTSKNWNYDRKR